MEKNAGYAALDDALLDKVSGGFEEPTFRKEKPITCGCCQNNLPGTVHVSEEGDVIKYYCDICRQTSFVLKPAHPFPGKGK